MEVPGEFYHKHSRELTRYITAEQMGEIIFVVLIRGQKQITVQFKLQDFKKTGENIVLTPWLQEIASYTKLIDWGIDAHDWCYISRSNRGDLRFTQKEKPVPRVKEPPWARFICEDDIEFGDYSPLDYHFGKWGEREVDVYKVWMDRDIPLLDRAMRAYRRLQDMNLTYDLLGHLTKSNCGSIIGLVTEPMTGRRLEPHDKKLVFSAMRELNKIGYILDAPHEGSMLVTPSGELRITDMHNVVRLPEDPKEREELIKRRERFCREWVFEPMVERFGGGLCWRVPAHTRGQIIAPVRVLVPQGSPEKILFSVCGIGGANKWAVERFRDIWSSGDPDNAPEIWKLVPAGGVKRLLAADSGDESESETVVSDVRRPTKKLRKGMERLRSETPLPPLPVATEDLPVVPPSVFEIQEQGRDRSSSLTIFGSRSASPEEWRSNVPSWMLEGGWLELARTTAFS